MFAFAGAENSSGFCHAFLDGTESDWVRRAVFFIVFPGAQRLDRTARIQLAGFVVFVAAVVLAVVVSGSTPSKFKICFRQACPGSPFGRGTEQLPGKGWTFFLFLVGGFSHPRPLALYRNH